jgi:membrane associated rhomboid family serine protease
VLIPLGSDVKMSAPPWGNWGLILATTIAFALQGEVHWHYRSDLPWLTLDGFGIGIIGHVLVHHDALHLIGNMLFLWVFGNAVAPRLGVVAYLIFYFASASFVGLSYAFFSDLPAVGASDAINAVVGFFLVLHPTSRVRTFFLMGIGRGLELPGWLPVLLWVAFDLWTLGSEGSMSSAAHLAGFAFGFVTAVVMLRTGNLPVASFEVTLLDLPAGRWLGR